MTWRLRDLVAEAARNLTTSIVRSALLVLATAGLVGASVWGTLR